MRHSIFITTTSCIIFLASQTVKQPGTEKNEAAWQILVQMDMFKITLNWQTSNWPALNRPTSNKPTSNWPTSNWPTSTLNWPLHQLPNYSILIFMYKFKYNRNELPAPFWVYFTENYTIHSHNTRQIKNFHVDRKITTLGQRSIKFKGVKLWNTSHLQ